jgi:hypothetical protein
VSDERHYTGYRPVYTVAHRQEYWTPSSQHVMVKKFPQTILKGSGITTWIYAVILWVNSWMRITIA